MPSGAPGDDLLVAGAVSVDRARHEVRVHEASVPCTPGEFRLLELLAGRPGQVFSRSQILERLHGFDGHVTTRTVDVHVMNLHPREPSLLVTVYGVGYKLADGSARHTPLSGEPR